MRISRQRSSRQPGARKSLYPASPVPLNYDHSDSLFSAYFICVVRKLIVFRSPTGASLPLGVAIVVPQHERAVASFAQGNPAEAIVALAKDVVWHLHFPPFCFCGQVRFFFHFNFGVLLALNLSPFAFFFIFLLHALAILAPLAIIFQPIGFALPQFADACLPLLVLVYGVCIDELLADVILGASVFRPPQSPVHGSDALPRNLDIDEPRVISDLSLKLINTHAAFRKAQFHGDPNQ